MGLWERIVSSEGVATYEDDYAGWAFDQARRIRAMQSNSIDLENIAEELEDLGKKQYGKLESLLRIVILHMLKWDYQPGLRSRSWERSVSGHRKKVTRQLAENSSLKPVLLDAVADAFDGARDGALQETGLADHHFPTVNPYTFDTIMNRELRLDDPE